MACSATWRDENGCPGAATGRKRLPEREAQVAHSSNRSLTVAAPEPDSHPPAGSGFRRILVQRYAGAPTNVFPCMRPTLLLMVAFFAVSGLTAQDPGSSEPPPAEAPASEPSAETPAAPEGSADRTRLNLLGEVNSASGESRRNENVRLTLIDNKRAARAQHAHGHDGDRGQRLQS